jgi:hypothetical protein
MSEPAVGERNCSLARNKLDACQFSSAEKEKEKEWPVDPDEMADRTKG